MPPGCGRSAAGPRARSARPAGRAGAGRPPRARRRVGVAHQALAAADAAAGADEVPVDDLVIGADAQRRWRGWPGQACHHPRHQVRAVKADHVMGGKVLQASADGPGGRGRRARRKGPCAGRRGGGSPRLLRGAVHAKRDIGLAEQKVLGACPRGRVRSRSPGSATRSRASIGGSRKCETTRLAVSRTVPDRLSCRPAASSASRAAASRMSCAAGSRDKAAFGRLQAARVRVNSGVPRLVSRSATWRPSVGWVRPNCRAAAEREPVSATARNERSRVQSVCPCINA